MNKTFHLLGTILTGKMFNLLLTEFLLCKDFKVETIASSYELYKELCFALVRLLYDLESSFLSTPLKISTGIMVERPLPDGSNVIATWTTRFSDIRSQNITEMKQNIFPLTSFYS